MAYRVECGPESAQRKLGSRACSYMCLGVQDGVLGLDSALSSASALHQAPCIAAGRQAPSRFTVACRYPKTHRTRDAAARIRIGSLDAQRTVLA